MLGKHYELRNPVIERQNFKNQQRHIQKVNEIFSKNKHQSIPEKSEEERIEHYFNRKAYHIKFTNQGQYQLILYQKFGLEKMFYQSQEDKSLCIRIDGIKSKKQPQNNSQSFPLSLNETVRKLKEQKIKNENAKILLRLEELSCSTSKEKIKKQMEDYFKIKHQIEIKRFWKEKYKLPPLEPRTIKLLDQQHQTSSQFDSLNDQLLLNSSINTSKDNSKINEKEIVKKLKEIEKKEKEIDQNEKSQEKIQEKEESKTKPNEQQSIITEQIEKQQSQENKSQEVQEIVQDSKPNQQEQ